MNGEGKMIRFIDSHYNSLFYIPDGGNVVLTYPNGDKLTIACKYIDEYHILIGSRYYHICQFAEGMERSKISYEPEIPMPLPKFCFNVLQSSGELIMIRKGEKQYTVCSDEWSSVEQNKADARGKNFRNGVTKQQSAAMLGGVLYGWDTPFAQVESYDFYGNHKEGKELEGNAHDKDKQISILGGERSMGRLINADKLIKSFEENNMYLPDVVEKMINDQPSVDAEPVRHGRWLKRNTSEMQETFVCCSICGYPVSYHWRGNENFCPNCGAKMDVE